MDVQLFVINFDGERKLSEVVQIGEEGARGKKNFLGNITGR
jgi:hypothetical protein